MWQGGCCGSGHDIQWTPPPLCVHCHRHSLPPATCALLCVTAAGEDSLFEVVPQYDATGAVDLRSFCRLRHVRTGCWLQLQSADERRAGKDEDADDASQKMGAKLATASKGTATSTGEADEEDEADYAQLTASPERQDQDLFGLIPVPEESYRDLAFCVSTRNTVGAGLTHNVPPV